jgi:GMP synthase-like glutamine amidotransferase
LVKLLLVNNYANSARERALRLRSSFEKNGSTGTIVSWDSLASRAWKDFDGVVLSGSYDMLSEPGVQVKFSREVELARTSGVPLLGVCFGHQILGFAFGSPVIKAPRPSLGYREAQVLRKEPLFDDLGPRVSVYESHYEVVSSLPKEFVQSARSRGSEICAMQHSRLPLFGVQFHPERNSKEMPEGDKIISNFVHSVRASL